MDTCEGNCTEVWQTVEGYHQICDHDDLSEEFDTIFDNLAYDETACGEDVHCNVVGGDEEANCSSSDNAYFYEHLLEYGDLDVEHDILDDDHHDHDHSHDGDTPDCECITGLTTDDLDVACNDTETLTEIQHYLVDNHCIDWCELHNGTQEWNANYWMELAGDTDSDTDHDHDHDDHNAEGEEPGWICFQAFSLLNQYHDYCPSGAINETLFHIFLDVCPDCIGDTHYDEDAADCDMTLNCSDGNAQLSAINYVSNNCMDTCDGNCTTVWQMVEGYHQICDHDDLSEEFDTIFDNLAYDETACGEDVYCNVVGNTTVNCSSTSNGYYLEHLLELGNLTDTVIDELLATMDTDGAFQVVSGLGLVASMVMMLWQ